MSQLMIILIALYCYPCDSHAISNNTYLTKIGWLNSPALQTPRTIINMIKTHSITLNSTNFRASTDPHSPPYKKYLNKDSIEEIIFVKILKLKRN